MPESLTHAIALGHGQQFAVVPESAGVRREKQWVEVVAHTNDRIVGQKHEARQWVVRESNRLIGAQNRLKLRPKHPG